MKRKTLSSGALFLVFILLCSVAAAAQVPILHVNFESDAPGPYSPEMIKKDWGNIVRANLYDRARIVQEEGRQSKVLRIAYPAGAVGPKQGGGQFVVLLAPSEELWLSYRVKFGEGFDFKRGGKLPGLTSGGSKYTGGTVPKGGDGWSARYMWRKGGQAVVYLYYVDMPGTYGEDLLLDRATFLPGKWHQLTQHIRVNAPRQSNGVLDVWFDGKKVLSRSDIRFRVGEKGLIDSLYFSTFHGGSTMEWAPGVDSFAFFDDFTIGRERSAYLDAPEDAHDSTVLIKTAYSYEHAPQNWKTPEDISAWIAANFSYDMARAVQLSETQRANNNQLSIYHPAELFNTRSGVCVDLSRFGVETLRRIDPQSNPKYLMIEFDPIYITGNTLRFHWLVAFRRDHKTYFFADSNRPGHIAGPYNETRDFIEDYERYRGRKIVAFREVESYQRQKRTRALKRQASEKP